MSTGRRRRRDGCTSEPLTCAGEPLTCGSEPLTCGSEPLTCGSADQRSSAADGVDRRVAACCSNTSVCPWRTARAPSRGSLAAVASHGLSAVNGACSEPRVARCGSRLTTQYVGRLRQHGPIANGKYAGPFANGKYAGPIANGKYAGPFANGNTKAAARRNAEGVR